MSGSTSFGGKGTAAFDPAAVAKVTPDSSADDIHIPTKEDKEKKKKKKKKTKEKGKKEGKAKGETKTGNDAAGGSQVGPRHWILKGSRLKKNNEGQIFQFFQHKVVTAAPLMPDLWRGRVFVAQENGAPTELNVDHTSPGNYTKSQLFVVLTWISLMIIRGESHGGHVDLKD